MITYPKCVRLAEKFEVVPEVIENDYLVELVLKEIARDKKLASMLVFRGGTCLHKVYFENYRFSEDLDFITGSAGGIEAVRESLFELLEKIKAGYAGVTGWKTDYNADRLQIFIGYNLVREIVKPEKNLKLDICKIDGMPSHALKKVKFIHDDFTDETALIDSCLPESIAADKISRISGAEKEPRDIYDLKKLFEYGLNYALLDTEFRKGHNYGMDPVDLEKKIHDITFRKKWEQSLSHQIKNLAGFDAYVRELSVLIKTAFPEKFAD